MRVQEFLNGCDALSRVCFALSHEKRIDVVRILSKGPAIVSQIAAAVQLELPLVSHHLCCLRGAGVVRYTVQKCSHVYILGEGVSAIVDGNRVAICCTLSDGDTIRIETTSVPRLRG